jgi:hypothetical protein
MKITSTTAPSPFEPVEFKILCETQDELDAFMTLLTSAIIDDALREVWPTLRQEDSVAFPLHYCSRATTKTTEFTKALSKVS